MALLEAMACGVPCVTYDCPFGPRSMITNMRNGILVKEGDKKEMVDKINYLIENEKNRKNRNQCAKICITVFAKEYHG